MKPQSLPATKFLLHLLGALGTLLCLAGCLGVWYVESRVNRAREHVFERVDQSLARVDRRLVETQALAAKSKITLEEIQGRLQDWTKKEATDRLAARFDVAAKSQQLAAGLRQADLLLDLSHETVQLVRQSLELGVDLGLSWNAEAVDPLLERIADIKEVLSQASEMAERLSHHFDESHDDASLAEQAGQAATIAARLLTTFGNVDSRLASFQSRLTDAQHSLNELNAKIHTRILVVTVCVMLFLLWMAAGQLSLWRRRNQV